ncbi:MAG: hypothetical protein KGJ90_06635 [Patescibacteria group bacterium]|nr:hypothetical protein [Patescibacteria group bacterium]
MAEKNKSPKTVKASEKPKQEFVSKEEFTEAVGTILDRLEALAAKPAPVAASAVMSEADKDIAAAGPNHLETNPTWDGLAKEIVGDYVDHTEVSHDKQGGIYFTIVIKKEKSNAKADYIAMYKSDRRTKEVGTTGLNGVEEWCKQVRANLKRTERN